MTALAAMLGILGVGIGLWWPDATAALIISFSLLRNGSKNLKSSLSDLADRRPVHVNDEIGDELVSKVEEVVKTWDWVADARVRFRDHGQVYFGEVFITVGHFGNISTKI